MASISYQDFLSEQEKKKYSATPEELSALRILFADPSVPVSQVAQVITKPIIEENHRAKTNPEKPSTYEYSIIWRTIADAVRQLTEYNDKLVELVVEIQKTPDEYVAFMQDFQMHLNEFAFECRCSDQNSLCSFD